MKGVKWSQREDGLLRGLTVSGAAAGEIARALGRTRAAVYSRRQILKERSDMQRYEREITKEQYDRAMENHGLLTEADMDEVFTTAELCGYGVYGAVVSHYADRYVVRFEIGDSCD